MTGKKPKLKELARELGVTSRAVIDRCRAEGRWVQNSISRLDAETERLVRKWFAAPADGPKPDDG